MTTHVRRGLIAIMALLVGLFVAGPAAASSMSAAPTPAPTPCPTDRPGYAAPGVCQLTAHVSPVCVNDVPLLKYSLEEMGTTLTTATITWVHPGGTDVVLTDQPLNGTLLWPGAVLDAKGTAVDWPGWTQQPDGTWTRGDAFDWARQPVQVRFEVNPSTVATVSYPSVAGACEPASSAVLAAEDVTPTSSVRSAVLAATGSDVAPYALGGAGLVLLGALLLVIRAAMHRQARQARRSTT